MPRAHAENHPVVPHRRRDCRRIPRKRTLFGERTPQKRFRLIHLPVSKREHPHVRAHDLRIQIFRSPQRVLNSERLPIRNERRIEVIRMHVRDS